MKKLFLLVTMLAMIVSCNPDSTTDSADCVKLYDSYTQVINANLSAYRSGIISHEQYVESNARARKKYLTSNGCI